jgi:hypothetical protein
MVLGRVAVASWLLCCSCGGWPSAGLSGPLGFAPTGLLMGPVVVPDPRGGPPSVLTNTWSVGLHDDVNAPSCVPGEQSRRVEVLFARTDEQPVSVGSYPVFGTEGVNGQVRASMDGRTLVSQSGMLRLDSVSGSSSAGSFTVELAELTPGGELGPTQRLSGYWSGVGCQVTP